MKTAGGGAKVGNTAFSRPAGRAPQLLKLRSDFFVNPSPDKPEDWPQRHKLKKEFKPRLNLEPIRSGKNLSLCFGVLVA